MALKDIAQHALEEIRAAAGPGATDGHEPEILAALDKAMHAAIELNSERHAEIVEAHLSHAVGVAAQINEAAEKSRGLLIANLSAMR